MSYPDKEYLDNRNDGMEQGSVSSEEKKSLMKSADQKKESRLPVGKLKWSQEDEVEPEVLEKISSLKDNDLLKMNTSKEKGNSLEFPKSSSSSETNESKTSQTPDQKDESNLKASFYIPKEDKSNKIEKEESVNSTTEKGSDEKKEPISNENKDRGEQSSDLNLKQMTFSPNSSSGDSTSDSPNKRNLSIEDTMGPIDFKEYYINPVDNNEQVMPKTEPVQKESKTDLKASAQPEKTKPREVSEHQTEASDPSKSKSILKKAVKILWVPALLISALIIGLMVGHSYIGEEPAMDVFDLGMWEHIYQLIFG